MGIINYLRQRKERKKQKEILKQYEDLFLMLHSFDQVADAALLFLDTPNRRVLISSTLAGTWADDEVKWNNLFRNIGLWIQYKISQEEWGRRRQIMEEDAIRQAKAEHGELTEKEIAVIRLQVDEELFKEAELMKVKLDDEYEFCICDGILRSDVKAEAIGYYRNGEVKLI